MGLGENDIMIFFDMFEMDYDKLKGYSFKMYMREAIIAFLNHESKATAYYVYNTFLDCYRIKGKVDSNFIELLDTLKSYEENAATFSYKERDHYVHSVNVFILGLYIYEQNATYRESFEKFYQKDVYVERHSNSTEEFFYQWGVTSLLHDIAYTVEVTSNQIKKFNSNKYTSLDPFSTQDLLSYNISITLGVEFGKIKEIMDGFVESMQKSGFVEHGYYSAIIVLKWYGNLIQKSGQSLEILYHPILNASTAILLHNFYKNTMQNPPFSLEQLSAKVHPMGYMLILCDELQEWNREAYGVLDKQKALMADSDIIVTDDMLSIHYITFEKTFSEDFATKKEDLFKKLLDIEEIFRDSVKVTCTTKSDVYIEEIRENDKYILPRPIIENLEKMAKVIHNNYNKNQLKAYQDKPLEYPTWETLPDTLKYSNIRQARGVFDKLNSYGYVATLEQEGREEIIEYTKEQIEELARDEHDAWWAERKFNGWTYAEEKNVDKKTSPYMLPYDELSETIKELDRDAVRDVFSLIKEIQLKVYKGE